MPSNHPQQDVELSPTNIQMIGECCSMVSNEDMYSTLYTKDIGSQLSLTLLPSSTVAIPIQGTHTSWVGLFPPVPSLEGKNKHVFCPTKSTKHSNYCHT